MKQMARLKYCTGALRHILNEKYSYRASALAFTTMLSLVPMVSVFVYVMTHFSIFDSLSNLAKDYVIHNFVPSSGNAVIFYLNKFTLQASQLPIFSILFLLVTAVILVMTIDDTMAVIWQRESRTRKNIFVLLVYPIIVLLIPIFIGLIALFSSALFYIFDHIPIVKLFSFLIPLLVNTFIFSLLYVNTAKEKIKWHETFLGSVMAAFLLEMAKLFFAVYVDQFSNWVAIYGALSSIPVLLVWLYIFWWIILYGAWIVKMEHH